MASDLVTPWLHALSAHFRAPPVDLFSQLPADLTKHSQYQESGLYLWRQAVEPDLANTLKAKISPIVKDIYERNWSHKNTQMNTYRSFQATSSSSCSCKYNYTGASRQNLYHRGGCNNLQPLSVTTFLDEVFHAFEIWGTGRYPMVKAHDSSADVHTPRDFNMVVVNEYDYNQMPTTHIPWHDDNMDQSCRNDEDTILTPVISISLGDSVVFAVMPNKTESPEFFYSMGGTSKWTNAKHCMRGRLAFLLHHGDVLLMTGKFQKFFQHKTWKRNANCRDLRTLTESANERNYNFISFEDDQIRLNNDNFHDGKRYVITGRHIHYHDRGEPPCLLNVLPRTQHMRTTVESQKTVIGMRHDSSLRPISALAKSGNRSDPRNKIVAPKAKSSPISLQPVKVEYLATTGTVYDETDAVKDDESDPDVPMSPRLVFEKTPSSDMSIMDARSRMNDLVEIQEIPFCRTTEHIADVSHTSFHKARAPTNTQSKTSKQVYRANDDEHINTEHSIRNQAVEQALRRAVHGVGPAPATASPGHCVAAIRDWTGPRKN